MPGTEPPSSYDDDYFAAAFAGLADPVFRRRWTCACALTGGFAGVSCRAVLEFGAGLGQNLAGLRAAEKWAVDISEVSAAACRSQGVRWHASVADVPDGHFDVILAHHSLEHVPDPHATLISLRRKAAADGLLFLAVPVEDGAVPADVTRIDFQRHLYSWTPNTLKNLCLSTGWRPLWIKRRCGRGLHCTLALAESAPRLFLALRDLADRFLPRSTGEIVACCRPDQP
jgi:Methyltransferase domain.